MGKREIGLTALLFVGSVIFFSTMGASADGGTVSGSTASSASAGQKTYRWDGRTFQDKSDLAIYFLQRLAREGITGVPSRDDDDEDEEEDDSENLTVRTEAASNVDEDGARLQGEVDIEDNEDVRVWFEYGERRNNLDEDTPKRAITTNADRVTFQATVNGLDEDTTYYYRAVAEDEDGTEEKGTIRSFTTDEDGNGDDNDNNGDEPDATTGDAEDVDDNSAQLMGDVDMNDFENGLAFFVFGKDESQLEDIEDDFDTYAAIDEDGDDLQKRQVASNVDDREEYELSIGGLDEDTTYYYAVGVEYEDDDGDEHLVMGDVESFATDN